mmetsp:Transcript_19073/g.60618  ORF Transcript_19073/g.60618 Transcript_19073/m.60618 type:complete len:236 (-) Transcript_19073:352-1059(-)
MGGRPHPGTGAITSAGTLGAGALSAVNATYSPCGPQHSEKGTQCGGTATVALAPPPGKGCITRTRPSVPQTARRSRTAASAAERRAANIQLPAGPQPGTAVMSGRSQALDPCGQSSAARAAKASGMATSTWKRQAQQPRRAKARPLQKRATQAGTSAPASRSELPAPRGASSQPAGLPSLAAEAMRCAAAASAACVSKLCTSAARSMPGRKSSSRTAFIAACGRPKAKRAFACLK